jgi:hypothetical protein
MVAACSESDMDGEVQFRSRPHVEVNAELMECALLVDRYVASVKSWAELDYKVAFEASLERNVTLFRISHVDDYRGPPGRHGAGTSMLVEADCNAGRILRELGML